MLKTVFGYLKKSDFKSLLSAVKHRIPRKIYYNNKAYIFKLDKQTWFEKNLHFNYPNKYTSGTLTQENLRYACNFTEHTFESYLDMINNGNLAFGVFENNCPVNINWVAFGDCYVRGMGYIHKSNKNDAYIYGIMTDPNQRGKGLYKNCLIDLSNKLFKDTVENIYQLVEFDNTPVLKTLPLLGYEKIIQMSYKIIFGIKFSKVNDMKNAKTENKTFIFEPKDYLII